MRTGNRDEQDPRRSPQRRRNGKARAAAPDPNTTPVTARELGLALKGAQLPLGAPELADLARQNGARQEIIEFLRGLRDQRLHSAADLERAMHDTLGVEGSLVDLLTNASPQSARAPRVDERASEIDMDLGTVRRDGGDGRIDLDTCSIDQLAAVDGIGHTMAENIVRYRDAHGGHFEGYEELCHVPGMTPLTINKLRSVAMF